MREIKFRAYDKVLKCMYQDFDLQDIADYEGLPWNGAQPKECIIMQFTGLAYDGQDIYEGDVVSMGDGNVPSLVFWDEKDCSFKFKNIKRNEVHSISKYSLRFLNGIIGNIYENPELLGGNHERT